MITIENLANKIAEKISLQLNLDEEKESVITYGLTGFFQAAGLLLIIIIIGIITNSLFESLIVFLSVGFMRKSTGGAHSNTMEGCNTVTVLSVFTLAILSKYFLNYPININLNLGLTMLVFLIGYIIFYRRVPIDSPNKPIVNPDKIRRLRKESFNKLILFLLLTIIAVMLTDKYPRFYSIATSIRMAVLWQAMSLTKIGISLLSSLDNSVNRLLDN